jgi:hypothetical protein
MARSTQEQQRDLISKLADRGEVTLQRLAEAPGAQRLLEAVIVLRERLEDQQKRITGMEKLEKRIAALEKKVASLERPARRRTTRAPARKAPPPAPKS